MEAGGCCAHKAASLLTLGRQRTYTSSTMGFLHQEPYLAVGRVGLVGQSGEHHLPLVTQCILVFVQSPTCRGVVVEHRLHNAKAVGHYVIMNSYGPCVYIQGTTEC